MTRFFLKKLWLLFVFVFPLVSLSLDSSNLEFAPDQNSQIKRLRIKNLSDLQQLTPYESVSVIQKRYLPKTFRGELNVSIASVINHTFFYLGGLSSRVGFFIREDHGIGVEGFIFLPAVSKLVTKELISPPNMILPFTAVLSRMYGGFYYKWSPIFGKFAVLNQKIIYFDMYMTVGAGASQVVRGLDDSIELESEYSLPLLARDFFFTASLGLGQMFALSQSWAFTWELKWLYTVIQFQNQSQYTPVDINLSLGVNYYFPGASYR